jgi:hypothetical protein
MRLIVVLDGNKVRNRESHTKGLRACAGEWEARAGQLLPHPAERDYPLAKGSNTHTKGRRRKKKKNDVPTHLSFLSIFAIFRSDFRKYFYGVFGFLMQRNGQKRDKKKFLMVFLNSPC